MDDVCISCIFYIKSNLDETKMQFLEQRNKDKFCCYKINFYCRPG